jgi:hypothetical protein
MVLLSERNELQIAQQSNEYSKILLPALQDSTFNTYDYKNVGLDSRILSEFSRLPYHKVIDQAGKRGMIKKSIISFINAADRLVCVEEIFNNLYPRFSKKDRTSFKQIIKDTLGKDKGRKKSVFISVPSSNTNKYLYGLKSFLSEDGSLKKSYYV